MTSNGVLAIEAHIRERSVKARIALESVSGQSERSIRARAAMELVGEAQQLVSLLLAGAAVEAELSSDIFRLDAPPPYLFVLRSIEICGKPKVNWNSIPAIVGAAFGNTSPKPFVRSLRPMLSALSDEKFLSPVNSVPLRHGSPHILECEPSLTPRALELLNSFRSSDYGREIFVGYLATEAIVLNRQQHKTVMNKWLAWVLEHRQFTSDTLTEAMNVQPKYAASRIERLESEGVVVRVDDQWVLSDIGTRIAEIVAST